MLPLCLILYWHCMIVWIKCCFLPLIFMVSLIISTLLLIYSFYPSLRSITVSGGQDSEHSHLLSESEFTWSNFIFINWYKFLWHISVNGTSDFHLMLDFSVLIFIPSELIGDLACSIVHRSCKWCLLTHLDLWCNYMIMLDLVQIEGFPFVYNLWSMSTSPIAFQSCFSYMR